MHYSWFSEGNLMQNVTDVPCLLNSDLSLVPTNCWECCVPPFPGKRIKLKDIPLDRAPAFSRQIVNPGKPEVFWHWFDICVKWCKRATICCIFWSIKQQWCKIRPDQYIIFQRTSIKAENPDLDNIFCGMQPTGILKMFVNLHSHSTSFSPFFGRRTATKTGALPGVYWMLPMPIRAWPWISIRDSMPTGMSQRDLSRVLTFCGVCTSKIGEQRRFSIIAGFGVCRFPTFYGGLNSGPIFRSCFLRTCYVSDIPFGGTDLAKSIEHMHIEQKKLLSLLQIKNSSVLVTGHVLL